MNKPCDCEQPEAPAKTHNARKRSIEKFFLAKTLHGDTQQGAPRVPTKLVFK
jgi:hypothetical protein